MAAIEKLLKKGYNSSSIISVVVEIPDFFRPRRRVPLSQAELNKLSKIQKTPTSEGEKVGSCSRERKKTWERIQTSLRQSLGVERFGIWFKNTELMKLDNSVLTIGVPNVIIKQYLEQKYKTPVHNIVRDLTGEEYEVRFDIDPKLLRRGIKRHNAQENGEEIAETKDDVTFPSPVRNDKNSEKQEFRSHHRFERLIMTECNRLPFLAAQEIGCKEMPRFDQLLVFGRPGLGKTAVLESIAHGAKNSGIAKKTVYVMAEAWCNEYYYSVQKRNTRKFRQHYRSCNMFLMDGIQFLQGKPAAQDELLFTAKTLQARGARVVLSCSQHPNELRELKPETHSFLKGAFWTELRMPPKNERIEITRQLAMLHSARLAPEVCIYLAEAFPVSMRELNASVATISTHAALHGRSEIDMGIASEALFASGRTAPKVITIDEICRVIGDITQTTAESLKGKSRSGNICRARHMVALLAGEFTDLTISDIGRHLGGRSHSTIKHSITKAADLEKSSPPFAGSLAKARNQLGG